MKWNLDGFNINVSTTANQDHYNVWSLCTYLKESLNMSSFM